MQPAFRKKVEAAILAACFVSLPGCEMLYDLSGNTENGGATYQEYEMQKYPVWPSEEESSY